MKKVDCEEYEKIKFKNCYTCVHSTIADRLGNCYCDIRHKKILPNIIACR